MVRYLVRVRDYLQRIHIGFGAYPVISSAETGDLFHRIKVVVAWSWSFTSSAEFKNEWSLISVSPYALIAWTKTLCPCDWVRLCTSHSGTLCKMTYKTEVLRGIQGVDSQFHASNQFLCIHIRAARLSSPGKSNNAITNLPNTSYSPPDALLALNGNHKNVSTWRH